MPNFKIDWLEFTIQAKNLETLTSVLGKKLNFNVFFKANPQSKTEQLTTSSNDYCVLITYLKRWDKFSLRFSGSNADYFYSKLKANAKVTNLLFPKEEDPRISRLDVKYCRKPKTTDVPSIRLFLQRCEENINVNYSRLQTSISRGVRGNRLTVGSRKSALYYRIYESGGGYLDFELEIKKRSLIQFQEPFFSNNFLQFEKLLEKHFSEYSQKYLLTQSYYMDWLAEYFRTNKTQQVIKADGKNIVVDYIQQRSVSSQLGKEYFYRLLQFLSFLYSIKGTKHEISRTIGFYEFKFKITDFVTDIGLEGSVYQTKKIVTFLGSLRSLDPVIITNFGNPAYGSYVSFPVLEIYRENNQNLVIKTLISQQLYEHSYPFLLPKKFLVAKSKYEIEVKLQLIVVITQCSIEKVFDYEAFLNQYTISNRKKYNIKTLIVEGISSLIESETIEKKFKIITKKDFVVESEILNVKLLNQSRLIYFYEKCKK